jgi:hypothetical protein
MKAGHPSKINTVSGQPLRRVLDPGQTLCGNHHSDPPLRLITLSIAIPDFPRHSLDPLLLPMALTGAAGNDFSSWGSRKNKFTI